MKKLSIIAALLLTTTTAFAQDSGSDGPYFGTGFYLLVIIALIGLVIYAFTRNRNGNQSGYNLPWRGRTPGHDVHIHYNRYCGSGGAITDNDNSANSANNQPLPPAGHVFHIYGDNAQPRYGN